MAPQRRSQRQKQKQGQEAAGVSSLPEVSMPDCQGESDQHQQHQHDSDNDAARPSKRPRRAVASRASFSAMDQQQQQQHPAVSKFEAERMARIAANQARLAALELPQLAARVAAAAPPKRPPQHQRGVSSKRSRGEQLPSRQSARTRGQAPDPGTAGGIDYEGRDGRVVLAAYTADQRHSSSLHGSTVEAAAPQQVPAGPLPFHSSNGDEASDAAFLQQLAAAAGSGAGAAAWEAGSCVGDHLVQLQLSGSDVAKMTKGGISCLAFHPSSSRPIIAAADKLGKVSLWDIDYHAAPDDQGDSSGYDGVLMFEPHSDYVSSLKWLGPTGAALLSTSYDGLVRRLDVETGVWDLISGFPAGAADDGWSAGEVSQDGSSIYVANSDGRLTHLDTRCSSSSSHTVVIANRKVNTLHLHANQINLVSSASDGSVAVWDVRQLADCGSGSSRSSNKLSKPVASAQHLKSSQAAYWEPGGGSRLLSISFDDTLKIWQHEGGSLQQLASIRHNNNTGRWVVPFRPAWSLTGDAVCVGDMKRGVAVFRADTGAQLGMLSAEALTAIPSRLALHSSGLLAAATSSGRVHVFR